MRPALWDACLKDNLRFYLASTVFKYTPLAGRYDFAHYTIIRCGNLKGYTFLYLSSLPFNTVIR